MNDSSHLPSETVLAPRNTLLQLVVGLLIGGAVAAAAIGLKDQLRPAHRTPGVAPPEAVVTPTTTETASPLTETPIPTDTPELELTVTPTLEVEPEVQSTIQAVVSASHTGTHPIEAPPPVFDGNLLPPPPVAEDMAVVMEPSESSPAKPEPAPESSPVEGSALPGKEEPAPAQVAVRPTAISATTERTEPRPAPVSAFLERAHLAQKQSEKAQTSAEEQQADRYAPTEFQEGLRLYTLGLESMDRERYQTAAKRFSDSADAFIQAGAAAERIHAAQETRTKARELVDQARVLVEKRAYQQAEKAYLAYLQQVPQDAQISLEYGEMLLDRLSYSRGIQVLSQTLKMPSLLPVQRGRIYWRFAEGHRRSGNLQAAIQSIRQAIQYDPQNSGYVSLLNQYQYEASERQRVQQQRQGSQQNLIQDLTGSVLDSLIH